MVKTSERVTRTARKTTTKMFKVIFLCLLPISMIQSNHYHNNDYDNIYNLVSMGSTFSGDDFDSFNDLTTGSERQCISICTYSTKCKAFDVRPVANGLECRFYDFDYDIFVARDGVLVNQNGVRLYSTKDVNRKTSCKEWYRAGYKSNGAYEVFLKGIPRLVYCYMEGEGGGWMAFQRRYDGSVDFHTKLWDDYKNGFGDGNGEYWLGNDLLHEITSSGIYDLLVVAEKFNGEKQTKRFSGFKIGSEVEKYQLTYTSVLNGYSGFSLFERCRNQLFTTGDQNNDTNRVGVGENCAVVYPGGWWFNNCHHDYMNGEYSPTESCPRATGVHWYDWFGNDHYKCLQKTLLMIKKKTTLNFKSL